MTFWLQEVTSEIQIVIDKLRSKFTLKELGSLSYFLGIKVKRDNEGMHLTLTKYIQDLLKKKNMLESKGSPTPISTSVSIGWIQKLEKEEQCLGIKLSTEV